MPTTPYASASLSTQGDGILYASGVTIPAAEGDLSDITARGLSQTPPPTLWVAALVADVVFTALGNLGSNTSYVVLQGDFSDGQWFDLAWCTWTGMSGSASFLLAAGSSGANSFQSRTAGNAPSPANGSNQCPLPGRFRFVGKSTITSGTSSSSSVPGGQGVGPAVLVTIRYRPAGPR